MGQSTELISACFEMDDSAVRANPLLLGDYEGAAISPNTRTPPTPRMTQRNTVRGTLARVHA